MTFRALYSLRKCGQMTVSVPRERGEWPEVVLKVQENDPIGFDEIGFVKFSLEEALVAGDGAPDKVCHGDGV